MGVELASSALVEADGSVATHVATRAMTTLEIGMRWFSSGSGGLDRVYYDLVNALPAQGIQVRGLVVQPADASVLTGGRVQAFARDGAALPQRLLSARRAIAHLVDSHAVDLVSAHFALYGVVALDRLRDLPLVFHFHGPWAQESNAEGQRRIAVLAKKAIESRVYGRADRFIVLSDAFANLLTKDYGVDRSKIRKVPGSVDLDRFSPILSQQEARLALGWPTDRPILLSVRRLMARMGLDRLVEAMEAVVRGRPDALLCIAGRGPLEGALRRQIEDRGLKDHVHLLGFVSDEALPLAYRAADINVVPTTALEGFGLTAAEALAAGTPSMVTPVGGLPEVVANLSPNLVFRSAGVACIADGLSGALSGTLPLPDSRACRIYAQKCFSTDLAAASTAAIYRELA